MPVIKRKNRKVAVHGTRSKYVKGCRCRRCKRAEANYRRIKRWDCDGVKPKHGVQQLEHGTRSKYNRDRCRCPLCKKANRDYGNRWFKKQEKLRKARARG